MLRSTGSNFFNGTFVSKHTITKEVDELRDANTAQELKNAEDHEKKNYSNLESLTINTCQLYNNNSDRNDTMMFVNKPAMI